jgi:transaldolase/glucose-6-phosphate isomerase
MTHPLLDLQDLGQSPWHDNIRRDQLTSGHLQRMVANGDITGLTSNPTIFEQAIAQSDDYTDAIAALAKQSLSAEAIFDQLALEDIRAAADVFRPVYGRTKGLDGYVSIEVSPRFANDTAATLKEAKRLWKAAGRPNTMIKIPATLAGLLAIEQCIADGVNVNVTLIFSLERYEQVIEAYLSGLEKRLAAGKKISRVASVASFFISRVDTLVDKLLDEQIKAGGNVALLAALKGQAAIANAKLAYALFWRKFHTERYAALAHHGAQVQRPLWASTSTKNPVYPDVYYVEALIGANTVNTMPPMTLVAYKDHGQPDVRINQDVDKAAQVFESLEKMGVSMQAVTQRLEAEGVAAFAKSFETLLHVVEGQRSAALFAARQTWALGKAQPVVNEALEALDLDKFAERLWKKDSTLWKPDDAKHQAEIKIRLGWLDVANRMATQAADLMAFAKDIQRAGFTHAVLCGMGGSSLAPEVLRETLGVAKGCLDLAVLDSTDPAAVITAETRSRLERTLIIVASKSGSTTEPNAFFQFFWKHLRELKGDKAGEHFIAITDPGTKMERVAQEHGFRRIFLNPAEIGGRYSALSFFGLVPAALMGIDVAKLVGRAQQMMAACGATIPAARNPGLALGAALGALTKAGRDKVTLVTSPSLTTFNYWVEQLVAESTGKEGRGILPVEGEKLGGPEVYGKDRAFVVLRFAGEKVQPKGVAALRAAGHPVLEFEWADAYDLGAEFFRWEVATAVACYILDVDPFDQPNVQESKDNTVRLLKAHADTGQLPDPGGMLSPFTRDFPVRLLRHLKAAKRGDYVALTAYVERTPEREKLLRQLQTLIRNRFKVAVTVGYGPRFLHSTGQLHKGGAANGVFIQFGCDDPVDVPVPGEVYSFSTLKNAQALGDFEALASRKCRALRVNVGEDVEKGLRAVVKVVKA